MALNESRVKSLLPLSLVSVILLTLGVPASGAGIPYVGVVNGSEVKVRTGGSQNHHAFAFVLMGQRVLVDQESNGWCRILIPRWIPVYVHKSYVQVQGQRGLVQAGELNVRALPSRSHEAVGSLHSGAEVQIVSVEGDWIKIVPPASTRAFISQRYLTRERDISVDDLATQLAKISEASLSPLANPSRREKFGKDGSSGSGTLLQLGANTVALRRAEARFAEVTQREPQDRDFSGVRATYQEIAGTSEDRTEVLAAEEALKRIDELDQRKVELLGAERSIAEVNRINQELDQRVRQARIAGRGPREETETYLARGWVTAVNRFHGYQGTHRLMKGNQVLYYLKSEDGKEIPLDLYLNKRVGVRGVIRELEPKVGANLIVVSEIAILADR